MELMKVAKKAKDDFYKEQRDLLGYGGIAAPVSAWFPMLGTNPLTGYMIGQGAKDLARKYDIPYGGEDDTFAHRHPAIDMGASTFGGFMAGNALGGPNAGMLGAMLGSEYGVSRIADLRDAYMAKQLADVKGND